MAIFSFSVRRRLRALGWLALAALVVYLNFFSEAGVGRLSVSRHDMAIVERPFRAKEANQLNVVRGDIVKVINTKDAKWWFVELSGKTGYVPATYILPMRKKRRAPSAAHTGNAPPVPAVKHATAPREDNPEPPAVLLPVSPRQEKINFLAFSNSVDDAWKGVEKLHREKPLTVAENRSAAFVILNKFFNKNAIKFQQAPATTSPPAGWTHWPKVTVITPTCVLRRLWHHNLYMMFKNQDYPGEIELLVGDGKCHKASCGGKKNTNSGVEPDSHFTEVAKTDPRVQYFFVDPGATTKAMTLGRKRNFLVEKGSGDIVVHFDDDDFYSSEYVRVMVRRLLTKKLFFIKYSHWITYGETFGEDASGVFQRNPTVEWERQDGLGWGWSYVYNRSYAKAHPFSDDKDESEEKGFVTAFRNGELPDKLEVLPDHAALALRIVSWSCIRFTGNTNDKECAGRDKCTKLPHWVPQMLWGAQVAPYIKMWKATGLKNNAYG